MQTGRRRDASSLGNVGPLPNLTWYRRRHQAHASKLAHERPRRTAPDLRTRSESHDSWEARCVGAALRL